MAPLGPPPPLCPWEYQPPQNLWAPPLHLPGFPGSIPQHPKAPGHSSHLPSHSEPLGPPAPSQGPSPISQLPPKPQTTPSSSLRTPHPAATPHSGLGGKHTTHMLGSPLSLDRQKSLPPLFGPPFLTPSSHRRPVPQLLEAVTTTCCALPHDEQSPCAEEQVGIGGGTLGVGTEGCVGGVRDRRTRGRCS